MEGKVSTDRRKACIKQCVKNISRPKQPGKCPDYVNNSNFTGPAWIPVGQKGDINKSTYVLEAKVKALKEKRNIIKQQAEGTPQEPGSPKKAKAWKMKPPTQPALQNAILEPQTQIHTYLTDILLDSADYPLQMQEESQGAILANPYVKDFETLSKAAKESTEEVKRVPGRNITEKMSFLGSTAEEASPNGIYASSSLNDLSFIQKSEETNGRDSLLVQAKEFENNSFMKKNDNSGKLWKTESWDSLGSGSSSTLTERVERNRSMLQEMLSTSQLNSHYLWEPHTLHHCKKEIPVLGSEEPNNEILPNDVAWNSSGSLQYSEGYSQELELSDRHKQAKQPLQRARMKARTNPLRASHNILPTAPLERRSACRLSDANAKSIALKDGDIHARENFSESSSGESSCGQQRKRGLSPSRVHFEDESTKDAEVRYLERLPQCQKRVLDSVLLSLGKEPLVSKPDLSGYINGDLQHKENNISKCDLDYQSMGQAATLIHHSNRECCEKGKPLQVNKQRKSSACESYVNNSADSEIKQTRNGKQEISSVPHEESDLDHTNGSKKLVVSQENSRTKTLAPKGTPLWILPSRQHVHTGCIRESHNGKVTYTDGVDSAIDSTTDTLDSCRADREEAGTNKKQLGIKTHWHGMPSLNHGPLCSSEKETIHREVCWANCSCKTNGEVIQDNKPNISQVEIGSRTNEANNCNEQGPSEVRDQVIQMSLPRSNQVIDLYQMAKDVKAKGHTRVPSTQLSEPISITNSQQLLSHDDVEDPMNSPTNNLGQIKQVKSPSQQKTKQTASYHLMKIIPAPPTTGKAHSSPMSYKRAVLTGRYKLSNQDPGHMDKANELSVPASFGGFQDMGISGPKEQNGMQNPKMLSKHQFLDLFSDNYSNIHTKPKSKTLVTVREKIREEQLQESDKMRKNQVGPSSSTCGVLPIALSTINLSLSAKEANFMNSTQSISKEAPVAEAQKIKAGQTDIIHCKPFEVFPDPKKQQSVKKGEISSTSISGLKKFFTTLSQSTKQRLGRFRCYSMEQICMPESGASKPNMYHGPETTCSSKMKKTPSLQSLQMVSPFSQLRKSSSVQNLHCFWGKHNRSNLYLLGESKDDEAVSNRKVKTPHKRSLSIEDIGSPNMARTVGRVVAVFPDGTSQLELQRPQQGNFGFRVSSGNGRPDTGWLLGMMQYL